MAHFNRLVTNHLTLPLAPWLPGFGVVEHVGRRSGRRYRTPVNVFKTPDGYVIALTYGTESDWVKNVHAADGCDLVTRGQRHRLKSPEIIHDERRVPAIIRPILRLMRVTDFLHLKIP
jgi:deazaflavin-dependent oxidoreductase (nitroreductase family)